MTKIILVLVIIIHFGCTNNSAPDMIIMNGNIYPVSSQTYHEAIAVKNGRILELGTNREVLKLADINTKLVDVNKAFVIPGLIEGHGHFWSLGESKNILNFNRTRTWKEVIGMVQSKTETVESGNWILGRGWHQEKWDNIPMVNIQGYPIHKMLSQISSNNPVLLEHASGHSLFANKKAMELAGVNKEMNDPLGGTIVRDLNGEPIGVFTETAMDIIQGAYKEYLNKLPKEELDHKWYDEIKLAEAECVKNGITSFHDAGASLEEIKRYKKLAEEDNLKIRIWSMLYGGVDDLEKAIEENLINYQNPYFRFNAVKAYVDGALGSRGAWMLSEYDDEPGEHGHRIIDLNDLEKMAKLSKDNNLQLCVHAIGDKGNREVLDIFESTLNGKERRWRIEHAQHLDLADIPRFKSLNILASMQTNHCTSDAPYVEKRLGNKRAKDGAYVWRKIIDSGARLNIGTDVPVEDINPMENYYAAITRKLPKDSVSFYPEQCLTRTEALYGYTMANAYASFQESEKGSLEIGKLADMTILSNNLLTCDLDDILKTKVVMTIINGNIVFGNE